LSNNATVQTLARRDAVARPNLGTEQGSCRFRRSACGLNPGEAWGGPRRSRLAGVWGHRSRRAAASFCDASTCAPASARVCTPTAPALLS
jgi:hypothetical protein